MQFLERVVLALLVMALVFTTVAMFSERERNRQIEQEVLRLERQDRTLSARVTNTEDVLLRARRHTATLERSLSSARAVALRQSQRLARVRVLFGGALPLTDDACSANIALAAGRGLVLPRGWELHCPGPALDWEAQTHWGITCPYRHCPEGSGPYVSISSPTYYVVAHELCHAAYGYGVGAGEYQADTCAARYGASLVSSPYN